jgi:hypothetical protein
MCKLIFVADMIYHVKVTLKYDTGISDNGIWVLCETFFL